MKRGRKKSGGKEEGETEGKEKGKKTAAGWDEKEVGKKEE